MQDKHTQFGHSLGTTQTRANQFTSVYYYLLTGIALMIAVFLFLPRVSTS